MKWMVVIFALSQCADPEIQVESKGLYITQEECMKVAELYNHNWQKVEPDKQGLHYSCIEIPELKP